VSTKTKGGGRGVASLAPVTTREYREDQKGGSERRDADGGVVGKWE